MELVLSTFTGAGLLDRAFQESGFCVVSLGDLLTGHDIRRAHVLSRRFDGVMGGSPCQDFSKARRAVPVKPYACDCDGTRHEYGYGVAMIREFVRIVTEAQPNWFLHENVPGVPDVTVPGFVTQRITINVTELGHIQNRWRTIQFGTRDGLRLVIPRGVAPDVTHRCVTATGQHGAASLGWKKANVLQGLPKNFRMPAVSLAAQCIAVGNGVPLPLGRALALAIRDREANRWTEACACGCARPVRRGVTLATDACRQRVSREDRSQPRMVTPLLLAV